MKYRHRLTQINTDKMKRKNPCKSVSQIEGSYTRYTARKEEMKVTERTGDREGAKRKRAGKSALMTPTHPQNRKLYIPPLSIGEK